MKTIGKWLTYGMLAAAAASAPGVSAAQSLSMKRLTIGSNPAGSTYFLLAGGFAKLFQEQLKVRATAQPHAGSSVYIPLIDKGEITMGLNSTLDTAMAWRGEKPYSGKMHNLRALARIWVLPYGLVVKANSGIRTMDDVKGKRYVVEIKPNVSLSKANLAVLATAGLKESDVVSTPSGGVVAGMNMVVEDRVDATTFALGAPQLRQAHSAVPGGVYIVPLGKLASDEMLGELVPGLRTLTVKPSPTLPMLEKPTTVAAFDTFLNINDEMKDEDAYLLAKTLHENWKKLQKDYPPLRGVAANELAPASAVTPYHPGAVKYYKEAGLWTAKHDEMQAKFMKQAK